MMDGSYRFALEVLQGLSERPKKISSKYFYDRRGSELFTRITELRDYYLTSCEREILEANRSRFSTLLNGEKFNLIELGAGDGGKTRLLIERFLSDGHEFEYLPIDISATSIDELRARFSREFPQLRQTGIADEYGAGLDWIREHRDGRSFVLFLGSNIGNFGDAEAVNFLRELWTGLRHGDYLLIGFDLKKDVSVMNRAYNDLQGVTREFNLNLLRRINRELGGDFDLREFSHYGTYNPVIGAMESYILALSPQQVYISKLEKTFEFRAFEPIHLEYSNKYLTEEVERYARESGFSVLRHFYDSKKYFLDSLWRVEKQ